MPSADVLSPNGATSSSDNSAVYTRKPSRPLLLINPIKNHFKQSNHSQLLLLPGPLWQESIVPTL